MTAQTSAPKPGDIVYNQHGDKLEFVSGAGAQYVVRPLFEDDHGDGEPSEWRGEPEIVKAIFLEPPVAAAHAEIAELEKRRAAIAEEVIALERHRRDVSTENNAMMDRLKRHTPLLLLDQILTGKITHIACDGSNNDIWTIVDVVAERKKEAESRNYRSTYLGVLKLNVDFFSKELTWTLSSDRDGNKDSRNVVPFTSRADAVAFVMKKVEELGVKFMESKGDWLARRIVDSCNSSGIEVPQALAAAIKQQEINAALSAYQSKAKELDLYRVRLEAAGGLVPRS